ncbi:MAG: HlyD family type I secretion periplasmic adaptor subunit [Proteobacteria bacterium]|nr:MAG: HlyD family type I secretion periplasmic adaptor subunit [Pseudomonadota bacterium]
MSSKPELQFLPAALEIEQTPPLPISRYILWAIMLLFIIAIAWACIGHVDIVGVAQGKIVPSGRVKTVQPLETGIVKAIHVTEGQQVAAGDVLIELEDAKAQADLTRVRQERDAAQVESTKVNAQLEALENYPTPQAYFTRTPGSSSLIPEAEQNPTLKARVTKALNEHYATIASIEEEMIQNRAERTTYERRIAQLDATIPLITERTEALMQLEKQSLAPRAHWLELEEERVEQEKDRDVIRAQLMVTDAAYQNLKQRRNALVAQTHSAWLTQRVDLETRLKSFDQEILKAQTRVNELQLTAPVTGTVQQLAVNTVGGVVTPAEKLMLIVPGEDALRVEAWIPNKDIGFVHDGQAAEIKIETFPFTKYGVIDGTIDTISNDAIADENLGLVYLAQITMAKTTMWVNDRVVNLSPGMAVTVEVDMGKRRLIEFLLTPLLRYQDEGLQER